MNKADLVNELASKNGCSKTDAETWLNNWIEIVSKNMKKGDVRLVGFGTFKSAKRKAREGRNPQTGKLIKIPARTVPIFRASQQLKDLIK